MDERYAGCVRTFPKFFMSEDTESDSKIKWGGTACYKWLIFSSQSHNIDPSHPNIRFEIIKDIRKFIVDND